MLTFTPFHPEHLAYLTPHESQQNEYRGLLGAAGRNLASLSVALTAWHGSRVMGAGGVLGVWPGRGEAWGVFSNQAGPYMRQIAYKVRDVIEHYPARRIEMTVREDNVSGHRMAALWGFTEEAKMRAYHPDGSDMFMYVRIRQWQPLSQ